MLVNRNHSFGIVSLADRSKGPFRLLPAEGRPSDARPLLLDPQDTDISAESSSSRDLRLYKTTDRALYDAAAARAGQSHLIFYVYKG